MITVHHLNNSRSQRILWMLEELGVPYEIQRYERDPETMLASTSRKVTLLFEERKLNATGMEADFATNNLRLLSNVNGKFIP